MDYINPNLTPSAAARLSDIERKFLTLRSSGASIRDIAKKLKKSSRTICEWNKKYSNELLELRNKIFCDLQQKIIGSKTERLEFLKNELDRIASEMKNAKVQRDGFSNPYTNALDLYMKLSDMISVCEIDLLKVGINFRDNIEPESIPDSDINVFPVFEKENTEPEKEPGETTENTDSNLD